MQNAVKESWWAPISRQVEKKSQETFEATKIASGREKEITQLNYRVASFEDAIQKNLCNECGQNLPQSKLGDLRNQISLLQTKLTELSQPMSPTLEALLEESNKLRLFSMPLKASSIRLLERQIRLMQSDIPKRLAEIKSISTQLQGINRDEIKDLEDLRQIVNRRIGALSLRIKSESAKINNAEKEILVKRRQMPTSLDASGDNEIAIEMYIATDLHSVMSKTVELFREEMKKRVEQNATDIFGKLRSENVVRNLVINKNYGLRQMDEDGNIFDHKGAGVAQVIALSLILALARSAALPGALVLDTPLARLDQTHRDNILKFLPTESKQVILLFQPTEEKISPEIEREFQLKVAKRYFISMGDSQHESHIRRV
jgi:DNA sulfur modification protein DndD